MGTTNDARWEAALADHSPRKVQKWAAMAGAACTLFGREGYTRASIDAVAAAAGVSTRTLYNHFPGGKAELFRTVVTWTSSEVKDAQLACLNSVLPPGRPPHPDNLERDLLALAEEFVGLLTRYADHFALVRHIHAEVDHVPREVLDAWHAAGPGPVTAALTEAFQGLADADLLDVHGDPGLTAAHFVALTSHSLTMRTHYGVLPLPKEDTETLVRGGVAAFLRAYRTT
ncbi:TetR/AcrR family transcriptional regulator [Streptomyces sp. NPDC004539]|uniref:TetR/AcrR family transcriptional regulator n=1 Tax=Streptomyces sp. NPDC004539 TaxID=3154280 RepID=UPI0033B71709